jgi:hypothetical protein
MHGQAANLRSVLTPNFMAGSSDQRIISSSAVGRSRRSRRMQGWRADAEIAR